MYVDVNQPPLDYRITKEGKQLQLPYIAEGTYIIEPDIDVASDYHVLSVKTNATGLQNTPVEHLSITCDPSTGFSCLDDNKQFGSVQHLIEFYKFHSGPFGCKLSRPFTVEMLSEMDIDELELIRNDITVISKLGEGEFGEVFKAIWRGELPVAVKKCKHKMDFLGLGREANALHKLRHKHIVQLLGICTQPRDEPFLVILEYMAKGDLLRWLKNESRRLSIGKHIIILAQIADAMQYLEAKNVIHRDLRCVNVLVDEDETIKLSDFGLARALEDQNVYKSETQFPIRWTAPEAAYEPHNYSVKSDVWSFGVLMYEVLTNGSLPYEDIRVDEIHRRIVAGLRLPNPNPNDSTCCDLYEWMLKCWNLERSCRPMFLELYQMLECAQERLE